jgi:DNA topoisomerase-1
MEDELDKIEDGELAWRKVLEDFYGPFRRQLAHGEKMGDEIVREIVQAKDVVCEKCGRPMLVRWNRYGRFLGCSGYPECRNTKTLDEPPEVDLEGQTCPQCGGELVAKTGRFGPFVACTNYPECRFTRPIESGQVLHPPTTPCPKCGSALVVKSGRYGPFVACSAYPECKHTQPITLGIKCPRCGEGELAQKRTRRGKVFFGCSRYPDCDFSTWSPPVEAECPACGSKLAVQKSTKRKGDYLKCVSCGNEFQAEGAQVEEASVEE